jgi:hypothetical protein
MAATGDLTGLAHPRARLPEIHERKHQEQTAGGCHEVLGCSCAVPEPLVQVCLTHSSSRSDEDLGRGWFRAGSGLAQGWFSSVSLVQHRFPVVSTPPAF